MGGKSEMLAKLRRRKGRDAAGSAQSRWDAIQSRDRSADGAFVYAVKSTGIYCRPSCPSRKPAQGQVIYFTLPEAAERLGFRACRRCRPRAVQATDPRIGAVIKVCRAIDASIAANGSFDANGHGISLKALAGQVAMSPHQLERAFRRNMGITPKQYADTRRMGRLKAQLRKGDNVTTALYEAGYGSPSRIYERAPEHMGMTPADYGRGGAGMQIHYVVVDSPLGRMLVGATHRGVSALYLGEPDAELVKELRKEYPNAELVAERRSRDRNDSLEDWVETILMHLRGKEPHLDLPTDVQGTAFKRRVWQELRKIPYGCTRTYTQIADAIGKPAAIRAVASACATNPVSVIVPCHRVVRRDGNLAGYRWGLSRKRTLLDNESAHAKTGGSRHAN